VIPLGSIRPYLGVVKVAVVVLAAVALYWRGYHAGVRAERKDWQAVVSESRKQRLDEYEQRIKDVVAANEASAKEAAVLAAKVTASEKAYAELLDRIPTKPLVIYETKPGTPCPDVRLAPDFRLRFNEAVLGTGPASR